MKLVVNKLTKEILPYRMALDKLLTKTIEILEQNRCKISKFCNNGIIELNFINAQNIRILNKKERGINKSTDVLSFSFLNAKKFPGDNLVGQIFIEPKIAKKQATKHNVSYAEEIQYLFVHGLLHIFGFEHETKTDFRKMFALQALIMPDPKWEIYVNQIYCEYFGGRGAESENL